MPLKLHGKQKNVQKSTEKENLIGKSLLPKSKKLIDTKRIKLATQSSQTETDTTTTCISEEDSLDDLTTEKTIVSCFETSKENTVVNITVDKQIEMCCETSGLLEDTFNEKKILYEKFKSLEDELNSLRKMLEAAEISTKLNESEKEAYEITSTPSTGIEEEGGVQ